MCNITLCPPGKTPDMAELERSIAQNNMGHGFVVRSPQGLRMDRGMQADNVLMSFIVTREAYPDDWAMWHSRFATQGNIDESNCHPFWIPNKNWAMAHNGVLPLSDGPLWEERSDSRILAEDHLADPDLAWEDLDERYFDTIDSWLGGSKVVVMNGNAVSRGNPVIIFGEKRGEWSRTDGCWWSNRPRKLYYWNSSGTTTTASPKPKSKPKSKQNVFKSAAESAKVFIEAEKAKANARDEIPRVSVEIDDTTEWIEDEAYFERALARDDDLDLEQIPGTSIWMGKHGIVVEKPKELPKASPRPLCEVEDPDCECVEDDCLDERCNCAFQLALQ